MDNFFCLFDDTDILQAMLQLLVLDFHQHGSEEKGRKMHLTSIILDRSDIFTCPSKAPVLLSNVVKNFNKHTEKL